MSAQKHRTSRDTMIKTLALLSLNLGIGLGFSQSTPIQTSATLTTPRISSAPEPDQISSTAAPARNNTPAPRPQTTPRQQSANPAPAPFNAVGYDDQLWGKSGDKAALIKSIDHSLRYIDSPAAAKAYGSYQIPTIDRDRVRRSLVRFRQLVVASKSASQLQAAVQKEFDFYQATGQDNRGNVKFTGYYEPIYQASRKQTAEYRYPIYKAPTDFASWPEPHPERVQLEGMDGLSGPNGPLAGNEIFWMRDRFEVILVQIQGSAELQLTDGTKTTVGFNGGTNFPYTSIGKELAKDGKVTPSQLSLPGIIGFFRQNPKELDVYIPRYKRFVFMKETFNGQAMGSINVPVTPERSIATDKSLMPPGALALVHTQLPFWDANNRRIQQRVVSRYVLDQDTGSAIVGPGRVDYFMGTGKVAGDRAGVTGGMGALYYLLLKNPNG
jgi:membrane-bound lytic murein transglycosylase A